MNAEAKLRPPEFRRVFVAGNDMLAEVVPQLAEHDVLAVDLEMGQRVERRPGGIQEWVHLLALVQLAAGDLSVVVDPLRCDIAPLRPLMKGPARKVFLGGGQDAALLARHHLAPVNIVDVGELALSLFGRRQDGMAALAERIYGISLDKTVRRTDWMARPLNPILLAYAHRDAELTLGIYYWFREHYPNDLAFHSRREFDPSVPESAPPWLQHALSRSQQDVVAIALEHGHDPQRDAARLAAELRPYLSETQAPRLLNRVLRVAGDLHLHDLLPEIVPFADSPSSLIRASAARAIGQIASQEEGEAIVQRLAADPLEDVRKAANAALKDLRTPAPSETEAAEEEPAPALDAGALSALEALRAQLEAGQ